MKFLIIFLLMLTSSFVLNAQEKGKIDITSGVGIGEIKLGMNETEVYSILKGEPQIKDYMEEMKGFKDNSSDFGIDSIVQFILGFDSCMSYNDSITSGYPIFSLYFLNHRLNFITITSYATDSGLLGRFLLDKRISFYDSMETCLRNMGCDYLSIRYGDYTGDHIYYAQGLELIYDKQKLTVIGIFPPDQNFQAKMLSRRDKILKEYSSIKSETYPH